MDPEGHQKTEVKSVAADVEELKISTPPDPGVSGKGKMLCDKTSMDSGGHQRAELKTLAVPGKRKWICRKTSMDPEEHQKAEVKAVAADVEQLKISTPPEPAVTGKSKVVHQDVLYEPDPTENVTIEDHDSSSESASDSSSIQFPSAVFPEDTSTSCSARSSADSGLGSESGRDSFTMPFPSAIFAAGTLKELLMAGITLFTTVYGHGLFCVCVRHLIFSYRELIWLAKHDALLPLFFDDDKVEFLNDLQRLKECEHSIYAQTSEDERVLFLLYHTFCLFMRCKIDVDQTRTLSILDKYADLLLKFELHVPLMEYQRFGYVPALLVDVPKHKMKFLMKSSSSKTSSKLEFVNTEKQIGGDTTEESVENVSVSNLSEPEVYCEKGEECFLSCDYLNAARYAATALCLLPPEDSDEFTGLFYHELGNFFFKIREPKRGRLTSRYALHWKLGEWIPESNYAVDNSLAKLEDFSVALLCHRNALKIRLKLRGKDEELADTYHAVGESHAKLADFPSALKDHESALETGLKLLGDHEKTAASYHAVGESNSESRDLSALKNHESALKIRLGFLGDHEKTAKLYHSVGKSQAQLGDFPSALKNHKSALKIRLKVLEDHEKTAESYQAVVESQAQYGDFLLPLSSRASALDMRPRLLEKQKMPKECHPVGKQRRLFEDFPSQLKLQREQIVESYHTVGNTHTQLGGFLSALKNHESALKIRLKLLGDHEKTAESYHAVGESQAQLKDFSSALKNHESALKIRLKLLGNHEKTAESYHAVGESQAQLGDFLSALKNHESALKIRLKLLGDHEKTAESYHAVGESQAQLGDFPSALKNHKSALKIRLKVLEDHEKTAESYQAVVESQAQYGDFLLPLSSRASALDMRPRLLEEQKMPKECHPVGKRRRLFEDFPSQLKLQREQIAESYHTVGNTHTQLGGFLSALKNHESALKIRLKLLGDHEKTAESYHAVGESQAQLGDFLSALKNHESALKIRLKLLGDHEKTAESYHAVGESQAQLGDFPSALKNHKSALKIRLKVLEDHEKTAESYQAVVESQAQYGDFLLPLSSRASALDMRPRLLEEQKMPKECHPVGKRRRLFEDFPSQLKLQREQIAESYHTVGNTHTQLGGFLSALKNHESALKIRLKLLGDHEKTAESYHAVGESQAQLKDFSSALKNHESALKIRLKLLGNHEKTAESYHAVGESQAQLGDFPSALKNHESALKIRLKLLGDHEKTAESYHAVGESQAQLGDFPSALKNRESALKIRLKLLGDHEKTAESYHAVGESQAQLGDFPSALKNHESALDIRLMLLGEHENTAESYHAVGESQAQLGNLSAALESHRNALNLQLKLLGEHEKTMLSYHAVTLLHAKLGDHSAELDSYKNALGIGLKLLRKIPGSHLALDESHTSWFRNFLDGSEPYNVRPGYFQAALGDFSAALETCKNALKIRLEHLGEHDKTAECYHDVGELQVQLGDLSAALESHKNALKIRLKLLGEHEKTVESYYKVGLVHAKLEDFSAELSSYKNGFWTCLKLLGVHTKIARVYHVEGHLLPEVALQPKSCVVGSDGGELSYYGCTVSIPAGALEEDTEIAISLEVLNTDLSELVVSPVLKLEPSNLTFKCPVKVTLPLVVSPSPAVPEAEWPELTLMCYAEEKWSKVHTDKFTFENSGSFECTHFSAYCFVTDGSGQTKLVKRLTCLLYKESRPIQQGSKTKVTVAICDDLQDVTEQLKIRLSEKGLCNVDGDQTLCVQCGERVAVQVNVNAVGGDAEVEPSLWVIPSTDVWAAYLRKFRTFCVILCEGNNSFEIRFDVRSDGGSEVELSCSLGTIEESLQSSGNDHSGGSSPEQPMSPRSPSHLLLLAETWGWSNDGGLSSITKEMAVQFAKNREVQVSCLVAHTSSDLQALAQVSGVHLYGITGVNGFPTRDYVYLPPESVVDVNVIVGYGKDVGRQVPILKNKFVKSRWIHVACSSTEDENHNEIQFCEESDLTFAIGSDVATNLEGQLSFCNKMVHGFTPGIFREFQMYPQLIAEREIFRVVAFYPSVKEFPCEEIHSIPTRAVGMLQDKQCELIAVCAPKDGSNELAHILKCQNSTQNLKVRAHHQSVKERCKLFVEADLLILPFLPFKTEAFGFIGLQALSACMPILVCQNSGLAKALAKLPFGNMCVVSSNRPEDWSDRIKTVKEKDRKLRLAEAQVICQQYDEEYSWKEQCKAVLEGILQFKE